MFLPYVTIFREKKRLGYAVAQLVEAPHFTTSRQVAVSIPDSGFEIFHFADPFACAGIDSTSNVSEYQEFSLEGKGGRCVGLTTLPRTYASCLKILKPQTFGALRPYLSLYRDKFTFDLLHKKVMYLYYIFLCTYLSENDHLSSKYVEMCKLVYDL
jgi:hypothetical protein